MAVDRKQSGRARHHDYVLTLSVVLQKKRDAVQHLMRSAQELDVSRLVFTAEVDGEGVIHCNSSLTGVAEFFVIAF